jgi:hypothetical protein
MIGAIIEFDDLRKISGLGERATLATVEKRRSLLPRMHGTRKEEQRRCSLRSRG